MELKCGCSQTLHGLTLRKN